MLMRRLSNLTLTSTNFTYNQNFIHKFVRTALRRCSSFSVYKERIYFSSITVGRIAAITDDCKSFAFGLRRFESFPTDFWYAATIMQNYIAVSTTIKVDYIMPGLIRFWLFCAACPGGEEVVLKTIGY